MIILSTTNITEYHWKCKKSKNHHFSNVTLFLTMFNTRFLCVDMCVETENIRISFYIFNLCIWHLILTYHFSKGNTDVSCGGEWTAAKNLPRKRSSVDCTGLEVATCRHQLAQKALNMKRGEIFAYSHFIVRNFVLPNNITLMFADVMCKLYKYLCRVEPRFEKNLKGALSVMHAKGHSINCQVRKNLTIFSRHCIYLIS